MPRRYYSIYFTDNINKKAVLSQGHIKHTNLVDTDAWRQSQQKTP